LRRLRRPPSKLAGRGRGVWDTLEDTHARVPARCTGQQTFAYSHRFRKTHGRACGSRPSQQQARQAQCTHEAAAVCVRWHQSNHSRIFELEKCDTLCPEILEPIDQSLLVAYRPFNVPNPAIDALQYLFTPRSEILMMHQKWPDGALLQT
jgi:hypothetical protein